MNHPIVLGCAGVFVVLVILAGVLILESPKFLEQGKAHVERTLAEEQRLRTLEEAWQPPSETVDERWFPDVVGVWQRERTEPTKGIPDLAISRVGRHAVYRSNGGTIEVDILPVNDLEIKALIERAEDAIGTQRRPVHAAQTGGVEVKVNRSFARVTVSRGNRTHIRAGLDEHTRFWWVKASLFVFRSRGPADSETFPEEFLRAMTPEPQ